MAIGGDGPWVIAVMWSLTAISIVFVALRIYTRVVVVKSFGVDDHVYNLAFSSVTGLPTLQYYLYDCRGTLRSRSEPPRHIGKRSRRPTARAHL
ncbi:hypothetical protein ACHAPQ_011072 [Fusarium lateritium]